MPEQATTVITADRLIDGTGGPVRFRPQVRIAGSTIAEVGTNSGIQADFAFPGCTLLPGFVDAHVHLTFAALQTHAEVVDQIRTESDADLLARAIGNAQAALRAGVTTLRDCGGRGLVTLAVRDAIRRRLVVGPDLLVSGMPVTTTGGHLHYLGLTADTASDVERAAGRMIDAGVDFLKVIATGGVMTPGSDRLSCQYDASTLKRAVGVASRAGLHTAAHVLARRAILPCVEAGVRTIEHCMWRVQDDRFEFDPSVARRIRDQGQFVGLTFTAPTWRKIVPGVVGLDQAALGDLDARFDTERRTIDAGVRYLIHTDAGVRQTPFGSALPLAIRAAIEELRLTPIEAIVAATRTPAEAIGLSDRGVVVPGKRADLVVVAGNPSHDPTTLGNVRAVFLAGQCVFQAPTPGPASGDESH